jgi:hypothetical protein
MVESKQIVRVTDITGARISGANVHAEMTTREKLGPFDVVANTHYYDQVTDQNGECSLVEPAGLLYITFKHAKITALKGLSKGDYDGKVTAVEPALGIGEKEYSPIVITLTKQPIESVGERFGTGFTNITNWFKTNALNVAIMTVSGLVIIVVVRMALKKFVPDWSDMIDDTFGRMKDFGRKLTKFGKGSNGRKTRR